MLALLGQYCCWFGKTQPPLTATLAATSCLFCQLITSFVAPSCCSKSGFPSSVNVKSDKYVPLWWEGKKIQRKVREISAESKYKKKARMVIEEDGVTRVYLQVWQDSSLCPCCCELCSVFLEGRHGIK